ncbi:MAG: 4-hydroxyphenylacetate 3-hydroxylase N-terminal domain-containing protein [Xanthobacteraceae bacterium]
MLLSGADKLERMRDGRTVYLGSERIDDVTAHPAFRGAAKTIADLYDFKRSDEQKNVLSFEEGGDRYSIYYLKPRSQSDLRRRTAGHKAIADHTSGMMGRTPDHVAGMITGLATTPHILDRPERQYGDNLSKYYEYARKSDLYCVFACVPPTGARNGEIAKSGGPIYPALRVVEEDDKGVYLSGIKMLATGAIFADEMWIGNLIPLDEKFKSEAITCALPVNAKGVSLWARQSVEEKVKLEADYPLSYRFDESDSIIVCDRAFVPWERVFLHNDAANSRGIYINSPANCYANHQSNVRFWSKMGLLVGVAHEIAKSNGIDKIPSVRETLGRLAALEATIGGLVSGQLEGWEHWPSDFACFNRRYMYAALNWCQEHHTEIVDTIRTLLGGSVLQMPASVNVLQSESLRNTFEACFATPTIDAIDRLKLFKLAWDLVGSEFAGRHMLYEKFYAGNSIVVRNQSDREAPWPAFKRCVERVLDRVNLPT